jgi:hypothetical protein
MTYQGFQNNKVNMYEFFFVGHKFKLKFEMSQNFELQGFELTRFTVYSFLGHNIEDSCIHSI